jgi:hypothetical protein
LYQYHALLNAATIVANANSHVAIIHYSDIPPRPPADDWIADWCGGA